MSGVSIRWLWPGRLERALSLGLAVAGLAGCGGAGESPSPSGGAGSPTYLQWTGSANGSVVKDANNAEFAVIASSRTVAALPGGTQLTGLTVDSAAQVVSSGRIVGALVLKPGTTGSPIAVFVCSNGASMAITVSANGWSQSCGGTGTSAGTGTGTGGTADGVNATQCVTSSKVAGRNFQLFNGCQVTVYVTWCTTGGTTWACGTSRPIGGGQVDYGQGTTGIGAGVAHELVFSSDAQGVTYFACAKGPSGVEPLVFLTNYAPPLGVCR